MREPTWIQFYYYLCSITKVEIMIVLFSTVLKKANSQMKSLHIQLEISNIPKLTFNLKQKKPLNFGIDQIMGEIYSCTTWKENAESCNAETICMIHPHSFVCCLKKIGGVEVLSFASCDKHKFKTIILLLS